MKIYSLIVLIIYSFSQCTPKKCMKSDSYVQFKNIFKEEKEMFDKPGEKQFKQELLSKICEPLNSYKKVLFVEEIYLFSGIRNGLIYVYDSNTLFYFSGERTGKIILGKGDNNNLALRKIVERLKVDFNNEAQKLEEYFTKKILYDAPLLQVILMDIKEGNKLFEFSYSSNFVLEENW